ncbi:MAG: hypothetical protein DYG98_02720 [Haliscomenobacteraceae bacterium CHB4]|nr:Chaperone protein HtpG [Saprospiraceae bacterium]MCE7921942.1 hypothetical protein [Haliscomenobacteraceae bacterium CHB4]
MKNSANFQVDPKLAELLGETYKSTEDAIKELVDNSYDADADEVYVILPQPDFSENPEIVIIDDGTGMKEQEVRHEYLKIANSRFSRKGERTFGKGRLVKGRKGIGKFAGLMVAEIMEIKTRAGGKETTLTISKEALAKAKYDLEKVKLPIDVKDCDKSEHGTIITLRGLNQNFTFPNPEKLKQILVWEYGRAHDFVIKVNDERVGIQDIKGETFSKEIILSNGETAIFNYTISEKPVKTPGVIFRVGDKVIGRPENFLKQDELVPDSLKKRLVGEISSGSLAENDVTADWGGFVENSKIYNEIKEVASVEMKASLSSVFHSEMNLAKARHKLRIDRELAKLPEFKRSFAEKELNKVLEKFYSESDEKVGIIISVMVDALEKDYYWNVVQKMEESRDGDIEKFSEVLSEFGFLEMAMISSQAKNRLQFLDELDALIANPKTLEANMHQALERNLWVFGSEYSLCFSNKTLKKAIEEMLDKSFSGNRASKRPDLLLGESILRQYLLIEFKKPSISVGREAERQALEYRDDLNSVIHNKKIQIFVVGGKVDSNISSHNERPDVKLLSYSEIVSVARTQLNWLIQELAKPF